MAEVPAALTDTARALHTLIGDYYVTSGQRSASHNAAVGGSETSDHVTGHAMDIVSKAGLSALQIARKLWDSGWSLDQIIWYDDGHVHIGDRGALANRNEFRHAASAGAHAEPWSPSGEGSKAVLAWAARRPTAIPAQAIGQYLAIVRALPWWYWLGLALLGAGTVFALSRSKGRAYRASRRSPPRITMGAAQSAVSLVPNRNVPNRKRKR